MEKVIGQPCPKCNIPYTASKKDGKAWCFPCWRERKESQQHQLGEPMAPMADAVIAKMRTWANGAQAKLNTQEERILRLEKEIKELSNLKTLMIQLTNKDAVDLHSSLDMSDEIPVIEE